MSSTIPTWLAILTGIAAVAGPAAALGAAWITLYYTNKRQQAEYEERKRVALQDQRRDAYRTLARITKGVDHTQRYDIADVAAVISEVELLTESPEVLETATTLLGATAQARMVARKKYTAGYERPARDEVVRNFIRRAGEKRDAFLEAARRELELPPSPTPLQQARVSARELLAQQIDEEVQES